MLFSFFSFRGVNWWQFPSTTWVTSLFFEPSEELLPTSLKRLFASQVAYKVRSIPTSLRYPVLTRISLKYCGQWSNAVMYVWLNWSVTVQLHTGMGTSSNGLHPEAISNSHLRARRRVFRWAETLSANVRLKGSRRFQRWCYGEVIHMCVNSGWPGR